MSDADRGPLSLFLNTLSAAAPKLAAYVLSFASAPIILAGLGLRQFGIWALTGGLVQYGAMLDLGVAFALSRYIAAHRDDRRLCGQYMAVAWLSVPVVTGILAGASMIVAGPVSHAVHGITPGRLRVIMLASVVLLGSAMASNTICAYPEGLRRMVVPNIALALGSVVNFIASVGAIVLGAGLVGYALANAAAGLAMIAIVAVMVVRSEGRLPFSRPRADVARELLGFSLKAQVVRLSGLINYQTDKVVIAFSVGPAAAGAYELANRAAIAVRELGIYAASVVDIELTAEMQEHGIERLRNRYGRLTSVSTAVGFPPMLLAMAAAPLLLEAWLGHAPTNATAVLVALCAAYLLAASTAPGFGVALAASDPGLVARTSIMAAVANVILTVALAPLFGIWGILGGTVIALTAGSIAQVIAVHRRFSLPASVYLDAVVPSLRWYGALAIPVAALAYGTHLHGRGLQAAALVGASILYLTACFLWALRAGRLPQAVISRLHRHRAAPAVSSTGT